MHDLPLQKLTVSDFRRIEGTREVPLDAPIVLIHGPNGTGKTSLLSALELALTGEIRSMERQSDRYRAHLPFFGQPYATVRAEVAGYLQNGAQRGPLTVNGSLLDGTPAFSEAAANFYAERCYLDQSSLGRLLDLYQARLSTEQTALEKFVNELLGLERLDALRDGLGESNDLRLLKKLAVGVDEADRQSREAALSLKDQSSRLSELNNEIATAREALRSAIAEVHPGQFDGADDETLLGFVTSTLDKDVAAIDLATAKRVHNELLALGGRISSLASRPRTRLAQETRTALMESVGALDAWEASGAKRVQDWQSRARVLGVESGEDLRAAVERAIVVTLEELDADERARAQTESAGARVESERAKLEELSTRMAQAHEQSSALVESLAILRPDLEDTSICPVCDRDFSEVSGESLLAHIDSKLANLSAHGKLIADLRNERDELTAHIVESEIEYARLRVMVLSPDHLRARRDRRNTLDALLSEAPVIQAEMGNGVEIHRRVRELRQTLDELESVASEERYIGNELAKYADLLQISIQPNPNSFESAFASLVGPAEARIDRLNRDTINSRKAGEESVRLAAARERHSAAIRELTAAVKRKSQWDGRIAEAKRRQAVAREVYDAATQARATIVHRVFTESLNDVWKTVFTTLAPNEEFIPSFGIPSATKKTFDIKLETTRRDGGASGPPQMMLSAGNLNTAALSLFVALHLAVDPVVPCLVFDDPVQAMDEVHIAQFAGLIRLLAKQNGRQVIIAVHERELFDYLSLELSPAYEGDELITVELGDYADGDGVTRHQWTPDHAIAR